MMRWMDRLVRRARWSPPRRAWVLGLALPALSALLAGPAMPRAAAAEPASTVMPSARAMGLPAGPLERPGDAPPDRTPYQRALVAGEDRQGISQTVVSGTLMDLVVAAGLGASDTFGDQETSIAVDPNDPNHITVSAFSGGWGSFAPLWVSTDGGVTWAKQFTLSVPPGQPDASGCPCDQTFDYGKSSAILFGTTLGVGNSDEPTWSGDTTDPTSTSAWQWLTSAGVAATTSHTTFSDQPWLMVDRDPDVAAQDDVYVAYTDYGAVPADDHVSVSLGASPPSFPSGQDVIVGTSSGTGFLASGAIRIATDQNSGTVYAAWEDNVSLDTGDCAKSVTFRLSRSTDHGQTWALNGGANMVVSTQESDEGWPDDPNQPPTVCHNNVEKFGTANALLGGSEAVAVDPGNGDLFYVYHARDGVTGNNRLAVARLTADGSGGLTVAQSTFLTGLVQAALPTVAVAENGAVGVLYDVYNGIVSGFPQYATHFATSIDHGVTWSDQTLVTFLSPATDNGNRRQRVLGDYQQVKAVGNTFYAAFPANGAAFGRSTSNIDPVFYKVAAPGVPLNFFTLAPCRIVDTRNPSGPLGGPSLVPHTARAFASAGTCGIPASARALSLNVTVTGSTSGGYIRLYPAYTALPVSSVINYTPAKTIANNAILSLGGGGFTAHLDSNGSVNLIVDVNGYFE
jgi:hypothetical protein